MSEAWKLLLLPLLLLLIEENFIGTTVALTTFGQQRPPSSSVPALTPVSSMAVGVAEAREAKLLDSFNHRYPDGSYEYRYELSDGTSRYERGYFVLINDVSTLMVVGYYAYRMTDGRYLTVFYNADQFGYRQNQSITPQVYPNLPRSIEVAASEEAKTTLVGNNKQQTKQPTPSSRLTTVTSATTATATVTATATASPTRRGRY